MRDVFRFVRNVASRDESRRLAALKLFAQWALPTYRFTWSQLDWWKHPGFNTYLSQFGEMDSFNTHRKWTLSELLRLTEGVPGDTAECGVYLGASSWLICAANRHAHYPRTHHLFDSFEGLSSPDGVDGEYWTKGDLAATEAAVFANLAEFENVVSHKGWIPDRFTDCSDKKFAFVHVDVDLYQPTKDSIEFFYDKLSPGGIFLCDDYAFATCPGATKAVDEFLQDKPEKMLRLDAGGGFFIRGTETSPSLQFS